jgi:hypothetical protein
LVFFFAVSLREEAEATNCASLFFFASGNALVRTDLRHLRLTKEAKSQSEANQSTDVKSKPKNQSKPKKHLSKGAIHFVYKSVKKKNKKL